MATVTNILNQAATGNVAEDQAFRHAEPALRERACRWLARFRHPDQPPILEPTDLVIEAYMRSIRDPQRRGHWANRAHFYNFAARTMRNLVIDALRSKEAERRNLRPVPIEAAAEAAASDPEILALVTAREEIERLEAALERLPQEQQDLVRCRFYLYMTLQQIADELGCSINTVRTHLEQAEQALRAALTDPTISLVPPK